MFNFFVMIFLSLGVVMLLGALLTLGSSIPAQLGASYRIAHHLLIDRRTDYLLQTYVTALKKVGWTGFKLTYGFVVFAVVMISSVVFFNDILIGSPPLMIALVLGIQVVLLHYAINFIFWIPLVIVYDQPHPVLASFITINRYLVSSMVLTLLVGVFGFLSLFQLYLLLISIPLGIVLFWGVNYHRTSITR